MSQHVNLMSSSSRRRQILRDARRVWIRVWVALALVMLVAGALQWRQSDLAARRLAAAQLQCQPIRDMRAQNSRMQQEVETIGAKDSVLLALTRQRSLLSLLGWTGRSVRQQEGGVYLEQFAFEQNLPAAKASDATSAVLGLTGTGRTPEAVRQLVATLRREGPFQDVDVQMQHSPQTTEADRQEFSIECKL